MFVFQPDRDTCVGIPFDDFGEPDDDAKKIKLKKYFNQEGQKMYYEYDFGDCWQHTLTLEKVLSKDAKVKYPQLIKGKGMCPPEDCGGIWGYYGLVEAVNDPSTTNMRICANGSVWRKIRCLTLHISIVYQRDTFTIEGCRTNF